MTIEFESVWECPGCWAENGETRVECWSCGEDGRIDHLKLAGPQYMLWHQSHYGWRFGVSTWHTLHQAERDAALFRGDGYETRILKVEVVDGEPVASWVGGSQP